MHTREHTQTYKTHAKFNKLFYKIEGAKEPTAVRQEQQLLPSL